MRMFQFQLHPLTPVEDYPCVGDTNTEPSSPSSSQSSPEICDFPSKGGNRWQNGRRRRQAPRNIEQRPYHSPNHISPPHDKPMTKNDMYFALDCEMVGIGPEGLDSAVARVTICNWAEQVILDTFVKVPVEVTDYRTFVSGIEAKHLEGDGAITLPEVRKIVKEILHGKILIGHALENDLAALQIDHPWHDIRDSANYPPFMKAGESDATVLRPRKLKELVRDYLGRDIQNLGVAHDPIEDAIAALSLYKSVRLDWEKLVMMQVASARVKETRETEPTSKKNNHASRYRPKKQTTRMEHATYSRSRSAPTTTGMTYYRGYGHHSYHPQQNYLY